MSFRQKSTLPPNIRTLNNVILDTAVSLPATILISFVLIFSLLDRFYSLFLYFISLSFVLLALFFLTKLHIEESLCSFYYDLVEKNRKNKAMYLGFNKKNISIKEFKKALNQKISSLTQ